LGREGKCWPPSLSLSRTIQKPTDDALALVDALTGRSPEMLELVEQERANLDIARKIYELRAKARLSQAELARKVGTTQSVISRRLFAPEGLPRIARRFNAGSANRKRFWRNVGVFSAAFSELQKPPTSFRCGNSHAGQYNGGCVPKYSAGL